MKKLILFLLMGVAMFLVNNNVASASDYWIYTERTSHGDYAYYAVEETLKPVKGAYHINVKEVGPGGKPHINEYGVYGAGNGRIAYYMANRKPIRTQYSNGHDLAAAIWQYATTHANF